MKNENAFIVGIFSISVNHDRIELFGDLKRYIPPSCIHLKTSESYSKIQDKTLEWHCLNNLSLKFDMQIKNKEIIMWENVGKCFHFQRHSNIIPKIIPDIFQML